MSEAERNKLSSDIIGCAIEVHKALGPGLLENAYEACLFFELQLNGILAERQKPMPLMYRGKEMDTGYRVDLFVENEIIVELKAVDVMHPVYMAQVITYLKLSERRLGLLINFNVTRLKDGIKRIIL